MLFPYIVLHSSSYDVRKPYTREILVRLSRILTDRPLFPTFMPPSSSTLHMGLRGLFAYTASRFLFYAVISSVDLTPGPIFAYSSHDRYVFTCS